VKSQPPQGKTVHLHWFETWCEGEKWRSERDLTRQEVGGRAEAFWKEMGGVRIYGRDHLQALAKSELM
jgi:hypothetical protein